MRDSESTSTPTPTTVKGDTVRIVAGFAGGFASAGAAGGAEAMSVVDGVSCSGGLHPTANSSRTSRNYSKSSSSRPPN